MAEQANPTTADLARAFTEAWARHDMDTAAGYLADDVVFDGPIQHTSGKEAYVTALTTFLRVVTGVKILAAFGDDQQALIMYDLRTALGTLTSAELLTFRNGKIVADRLTFDTFPIRKGGDGQVAPEPPAE